MRLRFGQKPLPGSIALDNFMRRKGELSGEHPDAKPVIPYFKDHDENAWYLQSATKGFQYEGFLYLAFFVIIAFMNMIASNGIWQ